jgi:integrase
MPRLNLTDKTIRAIKPTDKQKDYWDTTLKNFLLLVSPGGAKTFLVYYRHQGRQRRMKLGRYREQISLAKAREMARAVLADVVQGRDPAGARKAERQAETFKILTDDYVEHARRKKKRSWKEDQRVITVELLPAWGTRKAIHISRRDVRQLLQRIVSRDAPIMANRTLSLIRAIFNFAIDNEWMDVNPCYRIAMPAQAHERDRVLKPIEIRGLWKALDDEPASIRAILRLQLLTAQRVGEIRRMRREDLDLQTGWWTIPAEFSKNKKSHRVPLSPMALEIVTDALETSSGQWVFPAIRDGRTAFDYQTIHKVIRKLRKSTDGASWSSHDLRRTVTTSLASAEVPTETTSKILNHRQPGVTSIYNRHHYDGQKRRALDMWAQKLQAILDDTSGDNVLPFASGQK